MAKVKITPAGRVLFECPGCGNMHLLNVTAENGRPAWGFNGDVDKPTLTPSILDRCGHHVTGQPQPPNCVFCNEAKSEGYQSICTICHSFVRDGQIEFLNDCTHALAGKTVPLKDVE